MNLYKNKKIALGMVQLPPLPGTYLYNGQPMNSIMEYALSEAATLEKLGFDGYILQNMEDGPVKQLSNMETVAFMTFISTNLKRHFPKMLLGILVNWDGVASLAVAEACNADFIRVEHVYTRAEMTTFGIIEGQCTDICNLRKRLTSNVQVYADVYESHGIPIAPIPIEKAAFEMIEYAFADGIFISASNVNESIECVKKVKTILPDAKVIVGGGSNGDNVYELLQYFDGVCVGAWVKNGNLRNSIDPERANYYIKEVQRARSDFR